MSDRLIFFCVIKIKLIKTLSDFKLCRNEKLGANIFLF